MITEIIEKLKVAYPEARCELFFSNNFELLVAVMLSAQCTDKRVNEVTKKLFLVADTPQKMVELGQKKLEKLIYSCGFYKEKAKNIISSSQDLIEKHGGLVPDEFSNLIKLRGVGEKTANVVLSEGFNQDRIAVDTHVFRVSRRLGLSNGKTVKEVQRDLERLLEKDRSLLHTLLIFQGRYCCKAIKPLCSQCCVKEYCNAECRIGTSI